MTMLVQHNVYYNVFNQFVDMPLDRVNNKGFIKFTVFI